ncbi:hypothetical protein FDC06_18675 [Clostridium botulinum]|uniref:Uncharacterized protein n=1 Tax=Clostridium botulinum TaxID=1491 RepID=A0A6B4EXC1_CLOBO|nr:hypothetical protein DBN47_19290 [Clostridium botulinum]NEZ94149.1 hypothetical protein [Clostridium botulinum]NFF86155.1 hypothetical protein [Clostridium botulinum]NFH09459.1 hypothetical protein [Clostridium botulinum]NFH16573.1 hypothetical protein [Clostridium botulinum]
MDIRIPLIPIRIKRSKKYISLCSNTDYIRAQGGESHFPYQAFQIKIKIV